MWDSSVVLSFSGISMATMCVGRDGGTLDVGSGTSLHVVLSGHIGDVPWTAITARACGHACFKGCPRCFLLGQTVNSKGESLGATRFGGYKEEADAQILKFADQLESATDWEDLQIKYSKADGTFDKDVAARLKVQHVMHTSRAQGAEAARDRIAQLHPPPQLADEPHRDWQKRANMLHK
jgi:hypothetical protein